MQTNKANDLADDERECSCACTCGASTRCASRGCDQPVLPGSRYCIWHPTLTLARPAH